MRFKNICSYSSTPSTSDWLKAFMERKDKANLVYRQICC